MKTEFMVAATVTEVTPMVLQGKFGVARRSGRRWITELISALPQIYEWVTGVYQRFWDNAEATVEYTERMEAELGEAKAIQVYLYRSESALVSGRHFETLDLQNRCGVSTDEIPCGLGFRVEYVWVGGK